MLSLTSCPRPRSIAGGQQQRGVPAAGPAARCAGRRPRVLAHGCPQLPAALGRNARGEQLMPCCPVVVRRGAACSACPQLFAGLGCDARCEVAWAPASGCMRCAACPAAPPLFAMLLSALGTQCLSAPCCNAASPLQAGIHGHVFVNGGSLVGLSGGGRSGLHSAWRDFSTSFRWSIVSFCYRNGFGCGTVLTLACLVPLFNQLALEHRKWALVAAAAVGAPAVCTAPTACSHCWATRDDRPPVLACSATPQPCLPPAALHSQGAGIVWPTRIGKLELNLCQVRLPRWVYIPGIVASEMASTPACACGDTTAAQQRPLSACPSHARPHALPMSQVLTHQPYDQARRGLQFGFVPPSW